MHGGYESWTRRYGAKCMGLIIINRISSRARNLGTLSTHLLHCVKKVAFRRNSPTSAYSEHTSLLSSSRPDYARKLLNTSVATDRNSAPVVLGQSLAMRSKRMSRSTLMLSQRISRVMMRSHNCVYLLAWIRSMCARPSASGSENSTLRSNRPGLRSAGSRVSGLRLLEHGI